MEAFMVVTLQPRLLLFLFLSVIPFSSCQPQNIETFYPFDIPSPAPAPTVNTNPPTWTPLPPPTSPQPPSPLPESSSNNRTIVKAVVVTAASTSLVAVLFILAIKKYVTARSRREKVGDQISRPGRPPAVVSANEFTRFDGNLKGLIVDENGLDVVYWRKLEEGDKKNNFHKENFQSPRHEKEKKKMQEVLLLRGKSSSSHNKIQYEEDSLDQIITSRPPPASSALKNIEEKETQIQQSIVQSPPPPPTTTLPPVQNKRGPAPPPPPSVLAKKNPAPPPPPPNAGGLATSFTPPPPPKRSSIEGKGEESSAAVGVGNGQVKLKPLHWDKVNKNVEHSMVWDKIDGGSFRFDGDLMEALFGYVATNRKSPTRNNNSSIPTSPNSQVILLDARKSQNTAIVLKSLSLSRKELLDALWKGKELKAETLEKLTRIAPTEEEQSQIINFDGDPTRLADAESFHYHILKAVPSAYIRLNALLFRSNWDSEILHLKQTLQTLELGCKELRTRGLLLKLLEAILKAGNRMNAGTSRGNAQAFNLTALRKLSDVKSVDGKTTLLHFVVEEVVRSEGKRCVITRNHSLSRSSSSNSLTSENSTSTNERHKEYMTLGLTVVGGISAEFSNVKKAATIDYDAFSGNCSALSVRAAEIRELVSQCAADGGGFVKEMKVFLKAAEEELKVLRQERKNVMELVKKTTEYYQGGAVKQQGTHLLQLFVIIKDFLGTVDQVCVEIARNMRRRRTSMTGLRSSSPKSPAVRSVRFPNLPEHFLTDKSRSTSSESDSDS